MNRRLDISGEGAWRLWPVLLVLLAAALVPTVCVLWFMRAAIQNERLAVRQKLTDVYRQKVQTDQNEIAAFWSSRTHLPTGRQPAELFATIVRSGVSDSAIVYDESGKLAYPIRGDALAVPETDMPEEWTTAEQLEFGRGQYKEAASSYALAAGKARDAHQLARARQAEARCLMRADEANGAWGLLLGILQSSHEARDAFGRLIHLDTAMRLLQSDNPSPLYREEARQYLLGRLNAYEGVLILSSQRMFLMMELSQKLGVQFPTLAAEGLAAEYLDASQPPAESLRVTPTALPGLWQMASDDGRMVLLFKEATLISDLKAACKLDEPFVGITTQLELPGRRDPGKEPFLAVPVSAHFPGWELAVYLDEDPFAVSAEKAESAYLAAGVSAIAVIALLAVAMASYLGRQIRLTRLKNDLIATVSHELKTPLASMRVLVDTLREGRCADSRQASEYFELIAKENERLSRLIDNFLTFSRMERNKQAFEFAPVEVADAVQTAVAAVRDRFSSPEARLDVDLPADLPQVRADRDALVTVLLNLLDNAWKYSGDRKAVKVRAYDANGSVFIEVSDNGVGMSRRAVRRIFDKFHQVDQTLSRKAGGCGLGLSIVKFILDAHGGTIDVKSQPGKGSTFTIRLPAANAPIPAQTAR